MADAFKDREKGYENKWAHDEDLRFKVVVRRNKLLGLWAAAELGMSDPAAADYAKAVVQADFEEPGEEDVFRKIRADFDAAKLTHSDHVIRGKMDQLMTLAGEQVMGETK